MTADAASLFRRYGGRVYRWAWAMVRNDADALDAVQDVFLRLLRSSPGLTSDSAAVGWLRRVTANVVIDAWRTTAAADRAVRVLRLPRADADDSAPAAAPSALESDETAHAIRAAIADLSEQQRLVVLAKVFDGQTFAQIAAELGIAEPTAKTHYLRALAALRQRLADAGILATDQHDPATGEQHDLRRTSRSTG